MGIIEIVVAFVGWIITLGLQAILLVKYLDKKMHDRDLQENKSKLDGKLHVTKTRFDTEFATFKEISRAFFNMQVSIGTIYLPPNSFKYNPDDGGVAKNTSYANCATYVKYAEAALYENAPFIDNELYDKLHKFFEHCANLLFDYYETYGRCMDSGVKFEIDESHWSIGRDVESRWNELRDDIRLHIFSLEIID